MKKEDNLQNPPQPRKMIADEELVLFVLDSKTSNIDYDFFDSTFSELIPDFIIRVISCWKVLYVSDLEQILPSLDQYMKFLLLPIVYNELKGWEKAQLSLIELKVIRIVKYMEINTYAVLIRSEEKVIPEEEKTLIK